MGQSVVCRNFAAKQCVVAKYRQCTWHVISDLVTSGTMSLRHFATTQTYLMPFNTLMRETAKFRNDTQHVVAAFRKHTLCVAANFRNNTQCVVAKFRSDELRVVAKICYDKHLWYNSQEHAACRCEIPQQHTVRCCELAQWYIPIGCKPSCVVVVLHSFSLHLESNCACTFILELSVPVTCIFDLL